MALGIDLTNLRSLNMDAPIKQLTTVVSNIQVTLMRLIQVSGMVLQKCVFIITDFIVLGIMVQLMFEIVLGFMFTSLPIYHSGIVIMVFVRSTWDTTQWYVKFILQ